MDKQVFLMRLMDNLKREGGRETIRKSLGVCVCAAGKSAPAVHIK